VIRRKKNAEKTLRLKGRDQRVVARRLRREPSRAKNETVRILSWGEKRQTKTGSKIASSEKQAAQRRRHETSALGRKRAINRTASTSGWSEIIEGVPPVGEKKGADGRRQARLRGITDSSLI